MAWNRSKEVYRSRSNAYTTGADPIGREGGDLVGGSPDDEGKLLAGPAMGVPGLFPEEWVVTWIHE